MAAVPFSRGVNFTKWFESRTFEDIDFTKFTEKDFADVKRLGADVIRLPAAFHNFLLEENDHTLNPALLNYLDTAADWAEKHRIHLIIDNHSFHPINPTDDNIDKILIPVWEQLARCFSRRSSFVLYEVLNEPHGITDKRWGEIQGNVIEAIRRFDKDRQIIVGGTGFNSIEKLFQIPVYTDKNLIYTFHFYDPHIFTHQGATWNKPSLEPLSDLPFPAPLNFTPQIHETFKGTWVEDCLKNYERDSKLTKLSETLEKAVSFSKERDVPVFCGEFGVFMKQSPKEDRVSWYKFICAEFAKKNIPWICWDYFGGFGIFKTQSRGVFPDDLDDGVARAMGFEVN